MPSIAKLALRGLEEVTIMALRRWAQGVRTTELTPLQPDKVLRATR